MTKTLCIAVALTTVIAAVWEGTSSAALVKRARPYTGAPPATLRSLQALRDTPLLVQLERTSQTSAENELRNAGGHLVSVSLRIWAVPARGSQTVAGLISRS